MSYNIIIVKTKEKWNLTCLNMQQSYLNRATGIDTSKFAKEVDLADLKSNVNFKLLS